MEEAELPKVMSLFLDHVDPQAWGLEYRLSGTAAALAQGVRLPVGDIDILVRERDSVDRVAAALSAFPCLVPPVWLAGARQYFARFRINEVDVEFSTVETPTDADTFECIGRGPWVHYLEVDIGRHVVPVVRLELRLVSELVRDRADRYMPLVDHMRSHGADLDLVRRAMSDRDVDRHLRERILDLLH